MSARALAASSTLVLVGAVLAPLAGCCCCVASPAPVRDAGASLVPDAGPRPPHLDPGTDGGRDAGLDAGICPVPGRAGAACARGECVSGVICESTSGSDPLESVLGVRPASGPDPTHAGYMIAGDAAAGATPNTLFLDSLCVLPCSTSVLASGCGPCAACSGRVTQTPLLAALGGPAALAQGLGLPLDPTAGDDGICRAECAWRADGVSRECPEMACDPFDGVCIEACISDVDCSTRGALTYDGETVSWIDPAHPSTCNHATNRCEVRGTAGARVGDPCGSDDDCAPVTGTCLEGGLCGELACVDSGSACGTDGVCLGASATSAQTICVRGCNAPSDCPAGNACWRFPSGARVGAWVGYCFGACAGGDCHADETCADLAEPGEPPHLACVPPCAPIGAVGVGAGCADGEACVLGADTTGHGHCAPVDAFCGAPESVSLPAASSACAAGWVCDERLAHLVDRAERVGDGHCTPACASDADCVVPATCVTSGPLAGLCRAVCTLDADCSATEVCDPRLSRCVEAVSP